MSRKPVRYAKEDVVLTKTEKIEEVHKRAKDAAEYWQANFKPVTYSTPFFIGGDWVRVTIELISPSDAFRDSVQIEKRREDLQSDRSIDA